MAQKWRTNHSENMRTREIPHKFNLALPVGAFVFTYGVAMFAYAWIVAGTPMLRLADFYPITSGLSANLVDGLVFSIVGIALIVRGALKRAYD